jgi:hypothetical protein
MSHRQVRPETATHPAFVAVGEVLKEKRDISTQQVAPAAMAF